MIDYDKRNTERALHRIDVEVDESRKELARLVGNTLFLESEVDWQGKDKSNESDVRDYWHWHGVRRENRSRARWLCDWIEDLNRFRNFITEEDK